MTLLNRFGIIIILLVCSFNLVSAEEEYNWPRKIEKNGATIIIYQPQVDVSAAKFPDIDDSKIMALSTFLEEEVPKWEMELSLDELLIDLDMAEVSANLAEGLNNEAPEIIFASVPTMLILVDGDPIFEKIDNTHFERVVNTPYLCCE